MKAVLAILAALLALGALFYFYTAPTETCEMTEAEIAQVEAEVIAAAEGQHRAWRSQQDMDEYMSYHSGWAGTPWPNWQSLDDLRTGMTANWARWDFDVIGEIPWEVRVLGPEVAAVKWVVPTTRTDTTGIVRVFDTQIACVWVLEETGWKMLVARETWTRVEEVAGPNAPD
jgi:hypothetical protein